MKVRNFLLRKSNHKNQSFSSILLKYFSVIMAKIVKSAKSRSRKDLALKRKIKRLQSKRAKERLSILEKRRDVDSRRSDLALEVRKNNDNRRSEDALLARVNNDNRRSEEALLARANNDDRRSENAIMARVNNDNRRSDKALSARSNLKRERIRQDRLNINLQKDFYEKSIKRGPTNRCQCCNGMFFIEATQEYAKAIIQGIWGERFHLINCVKDESVNIRFCITCARDIRQCKMPRLCLNNGYRFPECPPVVACLTPTEGVLVSPRIEFLKITEARVGKQYKLKGNVVNVPISVENSVDILPRTFDNTLTIQLKLKRMKKFEHSYLNELIRPAFVLRAANYLVQQPLYKREGITLSIDWDQLYKEEFEKFIVDEADKEESDPELIQEDTWDETIDDQPVNLNKEETYLKQGIIYAPGEGQTPISILYDKNVEELSFPKIYCGHERVITGKHSYSDICRSELRSADRRCARDPTNIFFKYRMKEMEQQRDAINTFLRKGYLKDGSYNAQQALDDNFISNMINEDQAYRVLVGDRSSPAYWSQRMKDLMAMIRQIGIPTFFLTLSAAETQWKELLVILKKVVDNEIISEEAAMDLEYEDKCDLIRKDPITTARYFDHRLRQLFKIIRSPNGPFTPFEVEETYIRVEFQSRGSPHLHCLIWLKGAPVFESKDPSSLLNCETFIDKYISCTVGTMGELELLQKHKHSPTCKKNKLNSVECRFGLPLWPMGRTLILEPLKRSDLSEEEDQIFDHLMARIESVLKSIDSQVEKKGIFTVEYNFKQFLQDCQVTEETYIRVIRCQLKRAKVFLKRSPSEIRTNAYNRDILKLHRANMDIQFILDPYACVKYILNYINKSDRGMSAILKNVVEECKQGVLTHRQKLYRICSKFINCSEVSVQEAVFILLRLQLSRASRDTIFINTGERDSRIRILKKKSELKKLQADSNDIMSDGLLEYYENRPDELESLCLADFAAMYTIKKGREFRPENEDLIEEAEDVEKKAKALPLKSNLGRVIIRKRPRVIRFRKYQRKRDPEHYFREKVMLYLPWRNEERDILQKNSLLIFNENREVIHEIEKKYVKDARLDLDEVEEEVEAEIREYNQEKEDEDSKYYQVFGLREQDTDLENELRERTNNESNTALFLSPMTLSDDRYLEILRSLNERQRNFLLGLMNVVKTSKDQFLYYLSGGAGTGKSLLINAVYQSLNRWYNRGGANPDQIKVLLLGPTGKSAFNIRGTTIHSALKIPVSKCEKFIKSMTPDLLNTMRAKLWYLKVLIIDEISMVGSKMLSRIDFRLKEIRNSKELFGGISILFVGDFNQLKPVMDSFAFQSPKSLPYGVIAGNILWSSVKHYKLDQIMRQRDDLIFAQALNRLATGQLTIEDKLLFRSRLLPRNSSHLPRGATRLFSTNAQVNAYNEQVLLQTPGIIEVNKAEDYCNIEVSKFASDQAKDYILDMETSDTYGLPYELLLKVGVQYMVSTNVDIADGLCNGTTGLLYEIDKFNERVSRLWFDFKDFDIGFRSRSKLRPRLTSDNRPLTPIDRIIRDIQSKGDNRIVTVHRRQFPLVVAEAITIHKSQGQTYDQVVVDMTYKLQLAHFYTGLSRAKTLDGLFLTGRDIIFPEQRHIDSYVSQELLRLESVPLIFKQKFVRQMKQVGHLAIFFQNLPYLAKHSEDLSTDVNIQACDILALVETRSNNVSIAGFEHCHSLIAQPLRPFGISLYTRTGLNSSIEASSHYELGDSSASHLEFLRVNLGFGLAFIYYVSPNYSTRQFFGHIERTLGPYKNRQLFVVGDWNIPYKSLVGQEFNTLMSSLGLIRYPPTCQASTNSNTTIDYAFSTLVIDDSFYYESLVSDHKALISLISSVATE